MRNVKSVSLLLALATGCGTGDTSPDARAVDARPDDARAIDATGRPDAGIIDGVPLADCTTYYPAEHSEMPNYPVRFGDGQGLEESPNLRQTGLTELKDWRLDRRETIEKRPGSEDVGLSRTDAASDIPSAGMTALWYRGKELLLEAVSNLYGRRTCVDDGSDWTYIAPWTRANLRERYILDAGTDDIQSADHSVIGDCSLTVYDTGTEARLILAQDGGSRAQQDALISATGQRPRIAVQGSTWYVVYRDDTSTELLRGTIDSGAPTVPAFAQLAVTTASAAWDTTAYSFGSSDDAAITAYIPGGFLTPSVAIETTAGGIDHELIALPGAGGAPSVIDMAVTIWPERVSGLIRYGIAVLYDDGGTIELSLQVHDYDDSTGTDTLVFEQTVTTLFTAGYAISAGWGPQGSGQLSVLWEHDDSSGARVIRHSLATSGGVAAGVDPIFNTAIATGMALVSETPGDADDPGRWGLVLRALGDDVTVRSGYFLFVPATVEYVARSFVGYTGSQAERDSRPPKGSLLNNGNNVLTWGGAAPPQATPEDPLTTVIGCKVSVETGPNKPAELSEIVVSPHAGYPRYYDGRDAAEHDWHELPYIHNVNLTTGGFALSPGIYLFALTWASYDNNGLQYRSTPVFRQVELVAPDDTIELECRPLIHTERENVVLELWSTTVNGVALYKDRQVNALTGTASITLERTETDATLVENEQLNVSLRDAGPARVTDFVAAVQDRLWSVDPLRLDIARYSTPTADAIGVAPTWDTSRDGVLEPLNRTLVGVGELDGRAVLFASTGLSDLTSQGPSRAAADPAYPRPSVIPSARGALSQETLASVPQGLVFGSDTGPRLLSRGGSVQGLYEALARRWEIDGQTVIAADYDQNTEDLVIADSGSLTQHRRWNVDTQRWHADSRTALDLASNREGAFALLVDGDGLGGPTNRILIVDPSVENEGALLPPQHVVSTPWIREPAKDGQEHGGFLFLGVEIFGEWIASHGLGVRVFTDFDDTTARFEGFANVTSDPSDYRMVLYTEGAHCYACKVEVSITPQSGQKSARLAGLDIRWQPDGSGNPAEVPAGQAIPLTVINFG